VKDVSLLKKLLIIVSGSFVLVVMRLLLGKPFTLSLIFFWITAVGIIVLLDLTIGRWMRTRPAAHTTVMSIGAALVLLAAVVWLVSVFIGSPMGFRSTIVVALMIVLGLFFWWARRERNEGVPEQLR